MSVDIPYVKTLYLTEMLDADLDGNGLPTLIPLHLLDARRSMNAQIMERECGKPVAMPTQSEFAKAMGEVISFPRSRLGNFLFRLNCVPNTTDDRPSFMKACDHATSFIIKHPSLPKAWPDDENRIIVHVGAVVPARTILNSQQSDSHTDPRFNRENLINSLLYFHDDHWTDNKPTADTLGDQPIIQRVDGSLVVPMPGHYLADKNGNIVWKLVDCVIRERISISHDIKLSTDPWTGETHGACDRKVSQWVDFTHETYNDGARRPEQHSGWGRIPDNKWPRSGSQPPSGTFFG